MTTINPHINFNGNAFEAFTFYKSIFGGTFTTITRLKDMENPGFEVADIDAEKIMYIALPIGNNILMGNDILSFMGTVNELENRSKISVTCDNTDEAERIFNGLSAGGTVEFPMGNSPWGSYFGMFRDKYGIEWMINYDTQHKEYIGK